MLPSISNYGVSNMASRDERSTTCGNLSRVWCCNLVTIVVVGPLDQLECRRRSVNSDVPDLVGIVAS